MISASAFADFDPPGVHPLVSPPRGRPLRQTRRTRISEAPQFGAGYRRRTAARTDPPLRQTSCPQLPAQSRTARQFAKSCDGKEDFYNRLHAYNTPANNVGKARNQCSQPGAHQRNGKPIGEPHLCRFTPLAHTRISTISKQQSPARERSVEDGVKQVVPFRMLRMVTPTRAVGLHQAVMPMRHKATSGLFEEPLNTCTRAARPDERDGAQKSSATAARGI